MGEAYSTHGRETHTRFWKENLRSLGKPRNRWKDNIKMNLKEIGWEDVDWIHIAPAITCGRLP
jgi:hypothetical protein